MKNKILSLILAGFSLFSSSCATLGLVAPIAANILIAKMVDKNPEYSQEFLLLAELIKAEDKLNALALSDAYVEALLDDILDDLAITQKEQYKLSEALLSDYKRLRDQALDSVASGGGLSLALAFEVKKGLQ